MCTLPMRIWGGYGCVEALPLRELVERSKYQHMPSWALQARPTAHRSFKTDVDGKNGALNIDIQIVAFPYVIRTPIRHP